MQWLICITAALGFAFDIYEVLMLRLIVRPALMGTRRPEARVPGIQRLGRDDVQASGDLGEESFGLLGGYLADQSDGSNVLVWSILLYAFSAMGASFCNLAPDAALAPLRGRRQHLRGIRGRARVARGAVSGSRGSASVGSDGHRRANHWRSGW